MPTHTSIPFQYGEFLSKDGISRKEPSSYVFPLVFLRKMNLTCKAYFFVYLQRFEMKHFL